MKKTLCSCQLCKSGRCKICINALTKNENYIPAIEHGLIRSEKDIMRLNIIDWKRHNPWASPQAAMDTIFSWFNLAAHYTIMDDDMDKYPARDDFPGWKHVGNHVLYAKSYWNWFQYHHGDYGELTFDDSPDFYGQFNFPDGVKRFWGDIGQCSCGAIARSQKQMDAGDLWISIRESGTQIIIEPTISIRERFQSQFFEETDTHITNSDEKEQYAQLHLF
jgi:hypothetical protein